MMSKNSYFLLRDHGLIFFTTFLIFLFLPIYLITLSPGDYNSIYKWSLLEVGGTFSLIYITLFLFSYWVLYVLKLQKVASLLTFFVFFWVILAGYIFPLVEKSGMVEPLLVPSNFRNFLIVTSLSSLLTLLMQSKLNKAATVFVIVFLSLSIIPSLFNGYALLNSHLKDKTQRFVTLSKEKNIIVLSMDGLPGKMAYDLIAQNSDLQESFKDFILFNNVIATSPATAASITGELYGNMDLKSLGDTQAELLQNPLKQHLLINQKDQDVFTYHSYNILNLDPNKQIEMGDIANIPMFDSVQTDLAVNFFQYLAVRLGSSHLLAGILRVNHRIYGENNSLIYKLFPNRQETNPFLVNYQHHQGPTWDKVNIPGIFDFDKIVETMAVGASPASVRFMHFTFPHFPVDFDEHCNYRSYDKQWYAQNQNQTGLINETHCSLNKLAAYLKQLKKLNIYDNSLIILKSDHGQPAYYYSKTPENYKINGHPLWGYDRYRPMLLIKNYAQHHEKIVEKNELVTLNDLAQTLCKNSTLQNNCPLFPGVDLFGNSLSAARDLYIYIAKDKSSTFAFDTHKKVILHNNNKFLQSLRSNEEINLG